MGTEIANGTAHRQTRFPRKRTSYSAPDGLNSKDLPWEFAEHAKWPEIITTIVFHSEIAIMTQKVRAADMSPRDASAAGNDAPTLFRDVRFVIACDVLCDDPLVSFLDADHASRISDPRTVQFRSLT